MSHHSQNVLAAQLPERQVLTKPLRRECVLMVRGFGHAAGTHSLRGPPLWTLSPGTKAIVLGRLAAQEVCGEQGKEMAPRTPRGPGPWGREHHTTRASRCSLARQDAVINLGPANELDTHRGGRSGRTLKQGVGCSLEPRRGGERGRGSRRRPGGGRGACQWAVCRSGPQTRPPCPRQHCTPHGLVRTGQLLALALPSPECTS